MGQIARIIAPVLAAALALAAGLAAAAPAVNIATYKGVDREKLIIDGAKREGKVSIYSGMIENQALRPLVEAFERKYPFVDVEYWRGDSARWCRSCCRAARAPHRRRHLQSTGGARW
jgi:iron(III) transport system substrate-binding protein